MWSGVGQLEGLYRSRRYVEAWTVQELDWQNQTGELILKTVEVRANVKTRCEGKLRRLKARELHLIR
jgi:hypothetical protein